MKLYKKSDRLPFSYKLEIKEDAEFQSWSKFRKTYKLLMRQLYLFTSGQYRYHQKSISPTQRKILWLHNTTVNIGDSLMRLSGAALLKADHQIDLQTIDAVSSLYQTSNIFSHVFSLETVPNESYDLIILDALTTRCLKAKKKYYPNTPFVSLYEHFDSFRSQYNLILFSYFRMAELMGGELRQSLIETMACLEMQISSNIALPVDMTEKNMWRIGIVCGGNDDWRTYQHFGKVIKSLFEASKSIQIILLGSNNGLAMAETLMESFKQPQLISTVAKFTVLETAAIIKQLDILVTPDGGLMHIANALNVPVVALFARIDPKFRLTKRNQVHTLYDALDVNAIAADDISQAIQLMKNR
jgi:hypothetical protein